MTDHDALLRAICEHPAEDTPRLAFADWLDEHADELPAPEAARARAAFIRDDIAASRRDEYDPARLRWELIEKRLREKEGWVPGSLPPLPRGAEFLRDPLHRRGFPWSVTLKQEGREWWTTGAPVHHSARSVGSAQPAGAHFPRVAVGTVPVEQVRFYRCNGQYILDVLEVAPWRERVKALGFQQARFGPVSVRGLLRLPALSNVERLSFQQEGINSAEVDEFVAAPLFRQLAALTVTQSDAGGVLAGALGRAGAATNLRELHLDNTPVPAEALRELLDAPVAGRLRALTLAGDWTAAPQRMAALSQTASLNNLRSLNLTGSSPPPPGLEAFAASPLAPALQALDVSHCSLDSDRARLLAGGAFDNLRVLYLNGNPLGGDGASVLARSPHLAGLLVLDLSYSHVGDEGIVAILESPLADGLVLLDLTGSPASADTKELVKARMGDRVRV